MTKMKFEVELSQDGLPSGREVIGVTFRIPKKGEFFLGDDSVWRQIVTELPYPSERLIAKFEPIEPTHRPFANRHEFEPHRDKWARNKNDGTLLCRIGGYDDSFVFFYPTPDAFTYEKCLEALVFEDGSPFGVKVE